MRNTTAKNDCMTHSLRTFPNELWTQYCWIFLQKNNANDRHNIDGGPSANNHCGTCGSQLPLHGNMIAWFFHRTPNQTNYRHNLAASFRKTPLCFLMEPLRNTRTTNTHGREYHGMTRSPDANSCALSTQCGWTFP